MEVISNGKHTSFIVLSVRAEDEKFKTMMPGENINSFVSDKVFQ
jgi:hypothetical protein